MTNSVEFSPACAYRLFVLVMHLVVIGAAAQPAFGKQNSITSNGAPDLASLWIALAARDDQLTRLALGYSVDLGEGGRERLATAVWCGADMLVREGYEVTARNKGLVSNYVSDKSANSRLITNGKDQALTSQLNIWSCGLWPYGLRIPALARTCPFAEDRGLTDYKGVKCREVLLSDKKQVVGDPLRTLMRFLIDEEKTLLTLKFEQLVAWPKGWPGGEPESSVVVDGIRYGPFITTELIDYCELANGVFIPSKGLCRTYASPFAADVTPGRIAVTLDSKSVRFGAEVKDAEVQLQLPDFYYTFDPVTGAVKTTENYGQRRMLHVLLRCRALVSRHGEGSDKTIGGSNPDAVISCGAVAAYLLLIAEARDVTFEEVLRVCRQDESGWMSVLDLRSALEELGLETEAVEGPADLVFAMDSPIICLRTDSKDRENKGEHFYLVDGRDGVPTIVDPFNPEDVGTSAFRGGTRATEAIVAIVPRHSTQSRPSFFGRRNTVMCLVGVLMVLLVGLRIVASRSRNRSEIRN